MGPARDTCPICLMILAVLPVAALVAAVIQTPEKVGERAVEFHDSELAIPGAADLRQHGWLHLQSVGTRSAACSHRCGPRCRMHGKHTALSGFPLRGRNDQANRRKRRI